MNPMEEKQLKRKIDCLQKRKKRDFSVNRWTTMISHGCTCSSDLRLHYPDYYRSPLLLQFFSVFVVAVVVSVGVVVDGVKTLLTLMGTLNGWTMTKDSFRYLGTSLSLVLLFSTENWYNKKKPDGLKGFFNKKIPLFNFWEESIGLF